MRRIEALTGVAAMDYLNDRRRFTGRGSRALKVEPDKMVDRVEALLSETRKLRKELEKLQSQSAAENLSGLFAGAKDIAGVRVLVAEFESRDQLNAYADYSQTMTEPALGVFYNSSNQYAVTSSRMAIDRGLSAQTIIKEFNSRFEGRGGGRQYFTQGAAGIPIDADKLMTAVSDLIDKATA
jgi:alanyl-tRNA synthetase